MDSAIQLTASPFAFEDAGKDAPGLHAQLKFSGENIGTNTAIVFTTENRKSILAVLREPAGGSREKLALKSRIITEAIRQNEQRFLNSVFREIQAQGGTVDLSGVNLQGQNLRGFHFMNANLAGATLSASNMKDVLLINANLDGAIMDETYAVGAIFDGASMKAVQMPGANISGASMCAHRPSPDHCRVISTNLAGANMAGAIATGTRFHNANLRGAEMTGVVANNAGFNGAILEEAVLRDVDLTGADLSGANSMQGMIINAQTKSSLSFLAKACLKLSGAFSNVRHEP